MSGNCDFPITGESHSLITLPALAERYRKAEQQDDQIRVLEKLITLSESESHFSDLANIYWQQGIIEKWVELAR